MKIRETILGETLPSPHLAQVWTWCLHSSQSSESSRGVEDLPLLCIDDIAGLRFVIISTPLHSTRRHVSLPTSSHPSVLPTPFSPTSPQPWRVTRSSPPSSPRVTEVKR